MARARMPSLPTTATWSAAAGRVPQSTMRSVRPTITYLRCGDRPGDLRLRLLHGDMSFLPNAPADAGGARPPLRRLHRLGTRRSELRRRTAVRRDVIAAVRCVGTAARWLGADRHKMVPTGQMRKRWGASGVRGKVSLDTLESAIHSTAGADRADAGRHFPPRAAGLAVKINAVAMKA